MKGGVYTKQRCVICSGKFKRTENGLICPIHQTRPSQCHLEICSRELNRHMKSYSDSRGISFSSYEQADRIPTNTRAEIDAGSFDPD